VAVKHKDSDEKRTYHQLLYDIRDNELVIFRVLLVLLGLGQCRFSGWIIARVCDDVLGLSQKLVQFSIHSPYHVHEMLAKDRNDLRRPRRRGREAIENALDERHKSRWRNGVL
jgi:hypothetical protein